METFLALADKVGVPLALFAVTIIVVLLMQRSERKDTSSSIKVINDITIANHSALGKLQTEHRALLYKYGKMGQALTASESALRLFNETYQNDKEEWSRQHDDMQREMERLSEELKRVQHELDLRNNEIVLLKKAKA